MKKFYYIWCLLLFFQDLTAQEANWLIKPEFDSIYSIRNNYFAVVKKKKHGIVSIENKVLIPLMFDDLICPFSDEPFMVAVKKNKLWGFTNENGQISIPFQFEAVKDFKKNGLVAVSKNKKWGFMDTKGQIVIDFQYTFTSGFTDGKTALVGIIDGSNAGQWQIDAQNKRIVEEDPGNEYKEILPNNLTEPNHANAFFENGKYGLKKGNQIILEPKYENMYVLTGSYRAFLVVLNGKYGFVNDLGQYIVKPEFDTALTNGFNWVAVKQNGLWGVVKVLAD